MLINACVVSHPGSSREKNEDNFLFFDLISENLNSYLCHENRWDTAAPVLLCVFDGMGGASSGEVASRIAALVARSASAHSSLRGDFEALLFDICRRANSEICREMERTSKKTMGSTASMLLFHDDEFALCNIGDSPIFMYRYGRLVEISYEHTERRNMEHLNGASEKKKYDLTQHLGISEDEMLIEPNIVPGQMKRGDRIIICSDGLTDMVPPETVAKILDGGGTTSETAAALFNAAMQGGGADNITVMLIDAGE